MTYQPSVRTRARVVSRWCLAAAMAAVFAILAGGALAAADYPTKPVRVFVPYGPGGVGDLTMRLLADKLGDQLKQQFVIENRPGAGGIASATQVLRAPADGYTLGEIGNGQAISASLFNKLPFDVLKDFTPVSVAASFEMLLAVPGNSPYKSLKDVDDAAKKSPGKLNLGAINPGSTQNLSAHLFRQVTGADFAIVTYRTTPELVTALLRGDVDLGFDYYAAYAGEIGDGKLRIVATSGEERDPLLKDIPTAKESGFPQYVVTSWNGVAGPAGLPDEVVQILNREINRALAAPDLQQKARGLGIDARASTPQQMHDRMAADIAKWRDVIDKAGIPKQ
jgi:tripartite-type tricarboxylate transporter receptor subunit TctC